MHSNFHALFASNFGDRTDCVANKLWYNSNQKGKTNGTKEWTIGAYKNAKRIQHWFLHKILQIKIINVS